MACNEGHKSRNSRGIILGWGHGQAWGDVQWGIKTDLKRGEAGVGDPDLEVASISTA